ncbi:MAG: VOC family protein [Ktedonobacteraceae bacterium]
MNIRALDHAALLVKDVERSRHFYGQILEMNEEARPSNFSFPGAWFRKGTAHIHLIGEIEEGRADQVRPTYRGDELAIGHVTHLAFEVDNLEVAQKHLRSHNIEIVGGPRPRGDGVMQLYVLDPDGYVIEFFVFPHQDH